MKIALLVSFYNEVDTVRKTIEIFKRFSSDGTVICVQSEYHGVDTDAIRNQSDAFRVLPNLAGECRKYELAANAVTRNYSTAFSELNKLDVEVDYIVAILGDTFIYNWDMLTSRINKTLINKKAGVLQAIGQNFHSDDADPISGKCGGRLQTENTTDIMPQLFILSGKVCDFTDIELTNRFTTEQCLGDKLSSLVDFNKDVVRLNSPASNAYAFYDGVKLQHV